MSTRFLMSGYKRKHGAYKTCPISKVLNDASSFILTYHLQKIIPQEAKEDICFNICDMHLVGAGHGAVQHGVEDRAATGQNILVGVDLFQLGTDTEGDVAGYLMTQHVFVTFRQGSARLPFRLHHGISRALKCIEIL